MTIRRIDGARLVSVFACLLLLLSVGCSDSSGTVEQPPGPERPRGAVGPAGGSSSGEGDDGVGDDTGLGGGSGSLDDTLEEGPAGSSAGCSDARQCPEGWACVDGVCSAGCELDEDCADGNVCTVSRCEAGRCVVEAVRDRLDAPDDVPGDCRRPICQDGEPRSVPDDTDLPDRGSVLCGVPTCRAGVPSLRPDNSLCAAGESCWIPGGGCVPNEEVPPQVCAPVSHAETWSGACGNGLDEEGCPCAFGAARRCFSGPPTARGVGACADGTQVCQNRESPAWGPCVGSVLPAEEQCNGRDDGCDGCVDNLPGCAPVVNCPDNEVSQPFRYYDLDVAPLFADVVEGVEWTVEPPVNSNAGIPENPTAPRTRFFMDVSGDYRVTLRILDDKGTTYACSWVVSALGDGLRVELVWDTFGTVDMDLHLLRDVPGARFCSADDCYFVNCRTNPVSLPPGVPPPAPLDWGYARSPGESCGRNAGETCPNPRLDIDNTGRGASRFDPENINLDNPRDGDRFRVMVHHFSGDAPTSSVVSIYCGGALQAVFGEAPDRAVTSAGGSRCRGQTWRVADVTMHVDAGTGGTTCTVDPLVGPGGGYDIRTDTDAR